MYSEFLTTDSFCEERVFQRIATTVGLRKHSSGELRNVRAFHIMNIPSSPHVLYKLRSSSILRKKKASHPCHRSLLFLYTIVVMRTIALATAFGLSLISGAVANKDAITLITNGNSWIREDSATLVVPELPISVTGDIALWSAIMMDDYRGDFLQGVTSSSPTYVRFTDYIL